MNKEKLVLYALYVCGAMCSAIFIIVKSDSLMRITTIAREQYGALYDMAKVNHFKIKVPPWVSGPTKEQAAKDALLTIDDYCLFTIGDSFFDGGFGHDYFPAQLSAKLGQPVRHLGVGVYLADPFHFLKLQQVRRDREKILVFGTIERNLIDRFGTPLDPDPPVSPVREPTGLVSALKAIRSKWFLEAERRSLYFLEFTPVSFKVASIVNTLLFDLWGTISKQTPIYSINPPFLFYDKSVAKDPHHPLFHRSFYYFHDETLIARLADNIAQIRDHLKSMYNAALIFMPIPNKYTIYHQRINNDKYDDFLPRLVRELEKHGVIAVNLYKKFIAANELLYYPTDPHWNEKGVAIAVEETVKMLQTIPSSCLSNP